MPSISYFWMATNIYLTISNVDLVRKNDDERVQCSFGDEYCSIFFVYRWYSMMKIAFINKDGVIEYHDPHCKSLFFS